MFIQPHLLLRAENKLDDALVQESTQQFVSEMSTFNCMFQYKGLHVHNPDQMHHSQFT